MGIDQGFSFGISYIAAKFIMNGENLRVIYNLPYLSFLWPSPNTFLVLNSWSLFAYLPLAFPWVVEFTFAYFFAISQIKD